MGVLRSSFVISILVCHVSLCRADNETPVHEPHERHDHSHDHAGHDHITDPSKTTGGPATGSNILKAAARPSFGWPVVLLGLYCVAIIGASLLGGWLPQRMNLTHTRMQIVISLIGGFMLGIGVFHMLPHALVELGDDGPDLAAYGMMAGLLIMFLLLRVFHFHHHGPTEVHCKHEHAEGEYVPSPASGHSHDHSHSHDHGMVPPEGGNNLSWVGVFLGMSLHTLIDGLALGASVEADALHGATGFLGLGTFVAVFLHKPLDSVSITSVMAASGWSVASRTLVNLGFSLICPLGAVLFVLGVDEFAGRQSLIVGCALAISAGVFLCIALSDLLPEMEFHSHNRLQLTAALLAGVAAAWAIGLAESEHAHSHHHAEAGQTHKE